MPRKKTKTKKAKRKSPVRRKAPAPAAGNGRLSDHIHKLVERSKTPHGVRISNLQTRLRTKGIATTAIGIGKSVSLDGRMVSERGHIRLATGAEKAGRIDSIELNLPRKPGRKPMSDAERAEAAEAARGNYKTKRKINIMAAVELLDVVLDSKDLPAVARQKLLLTTRRLMTGED